MRDVPSSPVPRRHPFLERGGGGRGPSPWAAQHLEARGGLEFSLLNLSSWFLGVAQRAMKSKLKCLGVGILFPVRQPHHGCGIAPDEVLSDKECLGKRAQQPAADKTKISWRANYIKTKLIWRGRRKDGVSALFHCSSHSAETLCDSKMTRKPQNIGKKYISKKRAMCCKCTLLYCETRKSHSEPSEHTLLSYWSFVVLSTTFALHFILCPIDGKSVL